MSSVPVVRDHRTHVARAVSHMETGERLLALEDEWFAVAFFYSAYHMVKAAMHEDPIFDDIAKCAAVDSALTVQSRFAEHHSGGFGRNGRSLGVNEIVMKIYKNIRVPYTRLHQASIAVRYGGGLDPISPVTVEDDYRKVREAYLAGQVVAPTV